MDPTNIPCPNIFQSTRCKEFSVDTNPRKRISSTLSRIFTPAADGNTIWRLGQQQLFPPLPSTSPLPLGRAQKIETISSGRRRRRKRLSNTRQHVSGRWLEFRAREISTKLNGEKLVWRTGESWTGRSVGKWTGYRGGDRDEVWRISKVGSIPLRILEIGKFIFPSFFLKGWNS